MKLSRRGFLHLATGTAALLSLPHIAKPQAYPSRPVHIILGFPPGGSSDVIGRLMAQWLSERLGQPFVFENRPGAGSNIGTELVARASPDGYTLLWATSANAINATLYSNLNFDFIHNFAPVAGIFRVPNVLEVNPSVPVRTVPEFIAYAKANPGKLNFASGGIGSTSHLAAELFKFMVGDYVLHGHNYRVAQELSGTASSAGKREEPPAPDVKGPWYSLEHTFLMEAGRAKLPRPPITGKARGERPKIPHLG